jgi:hypothetical protein
MRGLTHGSSDWTWDTLSEPVIPLGIDGFEAAAIVSPTSGLPTPEGVVFGMRSHPYTTPSTPSTPISPPAAVSPFSPAIGAVVTGANQTVQLSTLFTVPPSSTDPTYLILSLLDRVEYTAGYSTASMGTLTGNGSTGYFTNFSSDAWSIGVVFTYQASAGLYYNATYGYFNQLTYATSSNAFDNVSASVFTTSNASLAATYAANTYVLAENPAYFTYAGSVSVVTQPAFTGTVPSQATPLSVVNAAMSFVGDAWNDNGCWLLASAITADAGASLPVNSTLVGVAGVANGEWIVAYNGPVSASANWVSKLTAGEVVVFLTASGGGHITTVVSGSGASALLVDNITYIYSNGTIANSANDGSPSDIIVAAPHAASQEFTGVNAAYAVVYQLDTPVCTPVAALRMTVNSHAALAGDVTVSNPVASQAITEYQLYDTNSADTITVNGVAQSGAHSAAGACTVASLTGVLLNTGSTPGTDTIDLRAFNGLYWGDWATLAVTITPSAPDTAAQAIAVWKASSTLMTPVAITDSSADISANLNTLQTLANAGKIASLSLTDSNPLVISATQVTADATLLALLPGSSRLAVNGATAVGAASLQSNASVARFSVSDTAANVTAANTALAADGKLTSISVTGTTGGDTLNLTGNNAPVTVNLGGDTAKASSGLSAPSLTFIGTPDSITLGGGNAIVAYALQPSSGVETITGFLFGSDTLDINLEGIARSSLRAYDTSLNGQHAVALAAVGNPSQGMVLVGLSPSITAATLLSDMKFAGGHALIV